MPISKIRIKIPGRKTDVIESDETELWTAKQSRRILENWIGRHSHLNISAANFKLRKSPTRQLFSPRSRVRTYVYRK